MSMIIGTLTRFRQLPSGTLAKILAGYGEKIPPNLHRLQIQIVDHRCHYVGFVYNANYENPDIDIDTFGGGVRAGEATHEVGTELATAGARRGAGQRILAVEAEHRHQLARR